MTIKKRDQTWLDLLFNRGINRDIIAYVCLHFVEYRVSGVSDFLFSHKRAGHAYGSENGKLIEITKQMPMEKAEGEYIGFASFKTKTLIALKHKVKEVLADEDFSACFERAIQRMIDETDYKIKIFDVNDASWIEIDFIEDYGVAKNVQLMKHIVWRVINQIIASELYKIKEF